MRKMLLSAVVFLAGCMTVTPPTPAEMASADYGPYPEKHKEIVQSYMSHRLTDPESARYEFLNAPQKAWRGQVGWSGYGYAVCANINAKNRYGGYTGASAYYFLIRDNAVVFEDAGDGDYVPGMVTKRCVQLMSQS